MPYPPKPKLFEPGSVAIDQRRNKIDDAIGWVRISESESCAQKITYVGEAK